MADLVSKSGFEKTTLSELCQPPFFKVPGTYKPLIYQKKRNSLARNNTFQI
jgi:hypothetical protein